MALEDHDDVAALRPDLEPIGPRIGDHPLDQPRRDAAAFERRRDQRVIGHACAAALHPGQPADFVTAGDMRAISFAMSSGLNSPIKTAP